MRVLHVIDTSEVGGGQTAVGHLLRGLGHRGVEAELACRPGGPLMDTAAAAGARTHAIAFDKQFSPRKAQQLARVAEAGRFDVIHTHGLLATYYTAMARECFGVGTPLVYHQHGFHHHNHRRLTRRARMLAERLLCWRSDRVVAVSSRDLADLSAGGYGARQRLRLVHYGLPEPMPVSRDAARSSLGLDGNAPVVGLVARLHPQKGVDCFLAAARLLHDTHPGARFVIVGTGELEDTLRAQVDRLGLRGAITWVTDGRRGVDAMPAFDVAVLSSRWEGLPLVLLEYMALRRPIVATTVAGCLDAIGPEQASLVPPDAPVEMAAAMRGLIDAPEEARARGASARARFDEQFTLTRMIERVMALYEEVQA